MFLRKPANFFEKMVCSLTAGLNWVAYGVIVVLWLLITLNIVIRYLYQALPGVYEAVEIGLSVFISFIMAYTALVRGHIGVEIVVSRLPQRAQVVIGTIIGILSTGMVFLISWQGLLRGNELWRSGSVSPVLQVDYFPFLYALSLGFMLFGLVLLVNLFKSLTRKVGK
jgi:TRAP-type C4-dicarboxylate transport system permease small subunit